MRLFSQRFDSRGATLADPAHLQAVEESGAQTVYSIPWLQCVDLAHQPLLRKAQFKFPPVENLFYPRPAHRIAGLPAFQLEGVEADFLSAEFSSRMPTPPPMPQFLTHVSLPQRTETVWLYRRPMQFATLFRIGPRRLVVTHKVLRLTSSIHRLRWPRNCRFDWQRLPT
jgi:hypothetical protein